MPIQQLPFELLENIFRNLNLDPYPKSFITSCAQVCQSWYLPACRVLYEELVVRDLGQILERLTSQKSNKGVLCKALRFTSMDERELGPLEQYQQILSHLPNLQTITLDSCALRSRHLKQLALYPDLTKHLKAILLEGDWRSGELQDFYYCANGSRYILQHMIISSLGETITTVDGRFGYMIAFLQDFTSLTTLQIRNRHRVSDAPGLSQLSMISVLQSCPNLASFSIESDFQEPEDDGEICKVNHSSLRSLDIKLPGITKHQINYIISNITQLKQFKLKCGSLRNHQDFIKWQRKMGFSHLDHFGRYLAGIERVELNIGDNFHTNILEYWPFVGGIISNSHSTPTHVFMMLNTKDPSYLFQKKMVLKKRAEKTNLQFRMNGDGSPTIDVLTSPILLSAINSPIDLAKNNIRSFHVYFQTPWGDPDPIYPYHLKVIENIINCYTNILDFSIKGDPLYSSRFQIKVASNDIEDVQFDSHLHCLKIKSPRLPNTPEDRLSYVKLQKVRSSKEILSILHLLPNTKYLEIIECGLTQNSEFNYFINMNTLSLKQLTLDISQIAISGSRQQSYVLQIEEKDSNRTLCYKWKRKSKNFEAMVFEPVDPSFLTQYRRFSSAHFYAIIIKCKKLEEICLYVKLPSQSVYKSDTYIDATLNLTT